MLSLSQYSALVDNAIRSMHLPAGNLNNLYSPISYALEAGGKRLRPMLTLMTCEAFGGNPLNALSAAIGVELFHNFTLLHDDVMDNSPLRRGRASVMAKYGLNTAILSGDTMLSLALRHMMQVPVDKMPAVVQCFNDTAIEVYEGQQLDMDFEKRDDVSLSEYIEMIRLKTSVLLGCAAKIGAIIAGATPQQCTNIYSFAEQLGIAFQIKDDLLDIYGDAATFGKPIGGDILNDKKTYLLLSALESQYKDEIIKAYTECDPQSKISSVTAIYNKAGIPQKSEQAITKYTSDAISALRQIGLDNQAIAAFDELAKSLTSRKK